MSEKRKVTVPDGSSVTVALLRSPRDAVPTRGAPFSHGKGLGAGVGSHNEEAVQRVRTPVLELGVTRVTGRSKRLAMTRDAF